MDKKTTTLTVEAYGVKGMNNTSWRKSFKTVEAMNTWAEKNDAEILGTGSYSVCKKCTERATGKECVRCDGFVCGVRFNPGRGASARSCRGRARSLS